MKATIYSSNDGQCIGTVETFDDARYANACDNLEGHCRAGDVLDDEDIERLGITDGTIIYALV